MTVRAKFRVQSIERHIAGGDEVHTIKMAPVYSDDQDSENYKFWKWTPAGEIELGTINREAAEAFELDGEYYVDFTPAEGG